MSKKLTVVEGDAPATEASVPAQRKPYFSHDECDHEKTPKARAACRARGEAAVYYGRDKAPKADAPTKTRKGRKLAAVPDTEVEVVEEPVVKKAKKVKVKKYPILWASKGTGAITHWAIDVQDDEGVVTGAAACGARITDKTFGRATEVQGCNKCRAKDPASLTA